MSWLPIFFCKSSNLPVTAETAFLPRKISWIFFHFFLYLSSVARRVFPPNFFKIHLSHGKSRNTVASRQSLRLKQVHSVHFEIDLRVDIFRLKIQIKNRFVKCVPLKGPSPCSLSLTTWKFYKQACLFQFLSSSWMDKKIFF